ncbi:MAG: S41 family peptidase [Melioribacteraceae bacterium]|nr:S41 family peptidase [Melioribacteraceae bacterium]
MPNKFSLLGKTIFIYGIIIFLFSGFLTRDNDIYFEINKGIDLFGRIYKEVTLNYVDEINPKEFVLAGIEGMLQSLDPYSNFIDINEQKDIDLITKGKYGGIGASIGLRNDEVTVLDLIEGSPAQRQGLKVGDVIKKIDETNISKENYDNLSNYLKGETGSLVKLIILRNGEELFFNIVREEIEIKNVSFYGFVPETSNNAYIKLSGFSQTAGEEVKQALLKLKSKKEIESLILDLRGNPGGLLDAAVDVCEKFLPKSALVVTVKGRDSLNVKKYFAKEEPILNNKNIIVLTNEFTASAAEVVAGALQDHDKAVIVGENSFGKGLVQTIVSLPYGTSLKLTTAKYFTPSGRCIQKIDYANNSKIFVSNLSSQKNEFLTDNKRKVFSSGGILPDSIVKSEIKNGIIETLNADGIFFKFITFYLNTNKNIEIQKVNYEKLYQDFIKYLNDNNYQYSSKLLKLVNQLEENISKSNSSSKNIYDLIIQLKNQFYQQNLNEIQTKKSEVILELKKELFSRILGKEGRIIESLKNDIQFLKSYEIITNQKKYNALLNIHN